VPALAFVISNYNLAGNLMHLRLQKYEKHPKLVTFIITHDGCVLMLFNAFWRLHPCILARFSHIKRHQRIVIQNFFVPLRPVIRIKAIRICPTLTEQTNARMDTRKTKRKDK